MTAGGLYYFELYTFGVAYDGRLMIANQYTKWGFFPMKLFSKITNKGIALTISDNLENEKLRPSKGVDQKHPRHHYVYAHMDKDGQIFYIGKGVRDRAWAKDRHPLWHRYVNKHLDGNYNVIILNDNMSSEEAENLETEWISQGGDKLVNWVNMARKLDYGALERFHQLRNANRTLMQKAKETEKEDIEAAASMYIKAIEATEAYQSIQYETGLVGQLLAEEIEEQGLRGELFALNRLTLCLVKLGRPEEATHRMECYFAKFQRDKKSRSAEKILKRIEKALARK